MPANPADGDPSDEQGGSEALEAVGSLHDPLGLTEAVNPAAPRDLRDQ